MVDKQQLIHFDSDYLCLAHPAIVQRMAEEVLVPHTGYGCDEISEHARQRIREVCGCETALVAFLTGGTQTNAVVIDALLASYQGVLGADTAHIGMHEAGAIEAMGHKVITLPSHEGKISAETVDSYMKAFCGDESWEHCAQPGMVYITFPTEYGSVYTLSELEDLHAVCKRHRLWLYLDGARIGYGLAAAGTDVTLKDIACLCDAFYIGGTKCGAMFGEAVVIPRAGIVSHFFTQIKRHGALLAKGWSCSLQFDTLLSDDLYFKITRYGVEMGQRLKEQLVQKGYRLLQDSPTNLLFFVLDNRQLTQWKRLATFDIWEKRADGKTIVRLVTSWSTREEEIRDFVAQV